MIETSWSGFLALLLEPVHQIEVAFQVVLQQLAHILALLGSLG